jgi:hypothetical protein
MCAMMCRDPIPQYFRGLRTYLPKTLGCVVENAFRNVLCYRAGAGAYQGVLDTEVGRGIEIILTGMPYFDVQPISLAHEKM